MHIRVASDGLVKISYSRGYSALLVPVKYERYSLCLSSQIGCSLGCVFCFSGRFAFESQLSVADILGQYRDALAYLKKRSKEDLLYSIAFLGMGEPLLNYAHVLEASKRIHALYKIPFSRMLLSTSGIIPALYKFVEDFPDSYVLAVSLHFSFQQKRDLYMPGLKKYPLSELITFFNYYKTLHRPKILLEYTLIKGVNDSDEDLEELCSLGLDPCVVYFNLLKLNGTFSFEGKERVTSLDDRLLYFQKRLEEKGFTCVIRQPTGLDIDAACGMLSLERKENGFSHK